MLWGMGCCGFVFTGFMLEEPQKCDEALQEPFTLAG